MVKNQRNSCCHMGCPPMIGDLHFHRGYSLRLQESKPLKNNGIISNAIAHRDYSAYVRGSYVQIRIFADRLEIQSPGGLFGNVTVENLEEEHSTRNARLMRMMEDMHIV